MIVKQKVCAGWDGNSHPAFLWKRINGKGYCQQCTFKLTPQKAPKAYKQIIKVSDKQKEKNKVRKENTKILHTWFNTLWEKLPDNKQCTICDKPILGENLSLYWDHLLEKSSYPELALNEKNICFVCEACHTAKTNGFPKEKHKELIEQVKKELL